MLLGALRISEKNEYLYLISLLNYCILKDRCETLFITTRRILRYMTMCRIIMSAPLPIHICIHSVVYCIATVIMSGVAS